MEGGDWWDAAEVVRAFIEAEGRDLDSKDGYGRIVLCHAASYGQLEVAKVLVQAGARVDVANSYGTTPLLRAAEFGHLEVCKYLD